MSSMRSVLSGGVTGWVPAMNGPTRVRRRYSTTRGKFLYSNTDGDVSIHLGTTRPTAREFLVAGVTRGDPDRGVGMPADWEVHSEVTAADDLNSEAWAAGSSWTLGAPAYGHGPPPAPPTGLAATATATGARLAWDYVSGAREYEVWQSTSSFTNTDNATLVATVDQPDARARITRSVTLSDSGRYHFGVRAKVGTLLSALSATVEVTYPPSAPTPPPPRNVPATPVLLSVVVDTDSADLTWSASTGADNYEVTYEDFETLGEVPIMETTTSTSLSIDGLDEWTRYRFTVTARNSVGDSNPSSPVTRLTSATVTGRVAARLVDPPHGTYDIEFAFYVQRAVGDPAQITPQTRFVTYENMVVGNTLLSGDVIDFEATPPRIIGRISAERRSDRRVRVCLRLPGESAAAFRCGPLQLPDGASEPVAHGRLVLLHRQRAR